MAQSGTEEITQAERFRQGGKKGDGGIAVELLDVAVEEGAEDGKECLLAGEADGKDHEVALEARVDDEAAARRVHGAEELAVLDDAQLQLGEVVPALVFEVLAQQADGCRRIVHVELRHVEVVHEVDQLLSARRPKVFAGLLLELPFHDRLEVRRPGVEVEVDAAGVVILRQRPQLAVDQRRLACSGQPDHERRLAEGDEQLEIEANGGGLARRHRHRVHRRGARVLNLFDNGGPRLPFQRAALNEKVKDLALGRELHICPFAPPPGAEVLAIVYPVSD